MRCSVFSCYRLDFYTFSRTNMNNLKGSLVGAGLMSYPLRRTDENLDLFSKNLPTLSVASTDDSSDVSVKLGRLSVGSAKLARSGIDDLLSSTDCGKHDYDWLLTPPGTPLFPSSDGSESQPVSVASRSTTLGRSVSTSKASRLSVSHSESHHSSRRTRSSSTARPSFQSSQFGASSSNRSSSILNTNSASVSSYTRPSSPISRSSSAVRPATPSSRPASRSSTPSRAKPAPANSLTEKTRPSQSSRPSTPNSRPRIPANLNSMPRSISRPSTPTRRSPSPSVSPVSASSSGRILSNGHILALASRPGSPGPRVRPQQPVIPPDSPLDRPLNLRTTLPDRPLSAGRLWPGAALTVKGTSPETTAPVAVPRRHSSPIIARGRLSESPGKVRFPSNGHVTDLSEPRKISHVSESGMRKPVKSSLTAAETNGFERSISKKSLDMAIRHTDIRNGGGTHVSGTTLFPQSIRYTTSKTQSTRAISAPEFMNRVNENHRSRASRATDIGSEANNRRYSAKLSGIDMYESTRYDAMLLNEDLKNTNWLHSIDDKSDQGPIFDNGYEVLPEPFGIL